MEFGIFAQLFVPRFERDADPNAEHKRIMRNVECSLAAEHAGLKYVWCPEHHFLDEYSHMPGPEVFLSFVGAQTERIHLGSAIFNITPPVNKPARVAETVALMDHLLDNRFEFGSGRGSSTTEVFGFDIDDLSLTKEMWRETITEIPKMWKQGTYSYEGKYFRMPEREVFPKPHGAAHPAMWVAAGSPPTFGEAGSLGLGAFCFSEGSPREIEPLVRNYKNAIANATPVGDYINDNLMAVTNLVCMEDRNEAFRAASSMGMNYYTSLMHHWLDNIPTPDWFPKWPEILPEATPEQIEQATANGYAVVGDPDDCAKAIQQWADIGVDQLTFSPTTNTLSTETVIASMELFGREVLPRFDKDPVHSTTKYREGRGRRKPLTLPDEFVALATRVSNWGRWGPDDQLGTLNLIDDAAIRRGAACVRTGTRISLSMPFDQNGPQIGSIPGRVNPQRTMLAVNTPYMGDIDNFCASDDVVYMGLQAVTHWDALAHASYSGRLYNGFPASAVTVEAGATKCGIDNVTALTTRGVLLDVARAIGVERLEPGHKIQPDELDAALALTGATVEEGDAVLVRTGHAQHMRTGDRRAYSGGPQPGLTMATVPWFRERDVAAVASDTIALECFPGEDERVLFPVHLLQLRDMGMTQGQNFDLEGLAGDCAADGVYEFLLEASPIPFTGGCGAPVNPVAVK